jgi:hypothetical protein
VRAPRRVDGGESGTGGASGRSHATAHRGRTARGEGGLRQLSWPAAGDNDARVSGRASGQRGAEHRGRASRRRGARRGQARRGEAAATTETRGQTTIWGRND